MTETMDSQLFPSPPALTGKNFTATAEQLQPFLVDCRRYLHQHPEVGFNEFNTAAFVRGILRGSGFEVHEAAETGSWLEIQGNKAGPTLAYRADLDALPMQDAKDAAYASKNKGDAH